MPVLYYTEKEFSELEQNFMFAGNILDSLARLNYLSSGEGAKKAYYKYIPLSFTTFISMIQRSAFYLKGNYPRKFLEVGSGNGLKLIAAAAILEHYSFRIFHGIEVLKGQIKFANNLVKKVKDGYGFDANVDCKSFYCDAFNFTHYSDYDLIYYYCPISDSELEAKLECLIEKNMKSGSLLVAALKKDRTFEQNKSEFECLYRSGSNIIIQKKTLEDEVLKNVIR